MKNKKINPIAGNVSALIGFASSAYWAFIGGNVLQSNVLRMTLHDYLLRESPEYATGACWVLVGLVTFGAWLLGTVFIGVPMSKEVE